MQNIEQKKKGDPQQGITFWQVFPFDSVVASAFVSSCFSAVGNVDFPDWFPV
ncbi:MAG: hypothetical protein RQ754_11370 [Desulfuromonadales bacterium]|nr:hypothetical protein [Desulfuromonadales bacterium]